MAGPPPGYLIPGPGMRPIPMPLPLPQHKHTPAGQRDAEFTVFGEKKKKKLRNQCPLCHQYYDPDGRLHICVSGYNPYV